MRFPDPSDDLFKAIADATRRAIVAALSERPMAVHEVAGLFDISRPAVSKHLRILEQAGLVRHCRAGKEHRYELERRRLGEVAEWLSRYWGGRLETLKHLAERKQ